MLRIPNVSPAKGRRPWTVKVILVPNPCTICKQTLFDILDDQELCAPATDDDEFFAPFGTIEKLCPHTHTPIVLSAYDQRFGS